MKIIAFAALLLFFACISTSMAQQKRFEIVGNKFMKDNEPYTIVSGSIHYFRSLPDQWADRLSKAKAGGLNTITTYVPWNMHNPQPNEFVFDGGLDIVRFIKTAQSVGLNVIVRASPYICAEWEFGGLPYWLLNDPEVKLRNHNAKFLEHYDKFTDQLLPLIAPFQYNNNGGPIIALQIENEYGSFGNDQKYIEHLRDGFIQRGLNNTLFFMSNGASDFLMVGGTIPGILKTINFGSGSNVTSNVNSLLALQPNSPVFVTEFWDGWFDHWGENHHVVSVDTASQTLDQILSSGASVNIYMYHGGTNFGFMNGANTAGTRPNPTYQPTVTSYDYDACLNESGDPTPKFYAFKKIIDKYVPSDKDATFSGKFSEDSYVRSVADYGTIKVQQSSPLLFQGDSILDAMSLHGKSIESASPPSMEELGQNYGFMLYRTQLLGPTKGANIYMNAVNDRAHVYFNGKFLQVVERNDATSTTISIGDLSDKGGQLDIFLENMGRVNYGSWLRDSKGLIDGVQLQTEQYQFGWNTWSFTFDNLTDNISWKSGVVPNKDMPVFYQATLTINDTPKDTFLNMDGWTKGVVWINGFNLGRYWSKGPQKTLYVPAPILKQGDNEVIVLELHAVYPFLTFQSYADLGTVELVR